MSANPMRGEASIRVGAASLTIRPSFQALVSVEEELGPLFALIDRMAEGRLALCEMVGLIWHCVADRPAELTREDLGAALVGQGLAQVTPVLAQLVRQILGVR